MAVDEQMLITGAAALSRALKSPRTNNCRLCAAFAQRQVLEV